jgi:MoaA/NifB/PqqE/SkfB family radical SAM enzyme
MKPIAVTAVVPAINGCNLKCAGCIIDQRAESWETNLSHEDYLSFFSRVLALPEVVAFALQGYEPLLPSVWDLSKELLRTAVTLNKNASCVTNGTYLRRYYREILPVTHHLYVSIDSDDPVIHDLSRGKSGAWKESVEGITALRAEFGISEEGQRSFAEYFSIASILYPNKIKRLLGMPRLLQSFGITDWVISPLISVRKGGYQDGNYQQIRSNLLHLNDEAKKYGVTMYLGDELRTLEHVGDLYQILSVNNLVEGALITRLSPDGNYSVGREILRKSGARIWNKKNPVEFARAAHLCG